MNKRIALAAAGLMLGAACLFAQAPQGPDGDRNRPDGPRELPAALTPEEKTALMTEKYKLTPEQQEAVLALNQEYDGKLDFRPEAREEGERKDPRSMSESERQVFFEQMMDRMDEMQEKMAQVQKDQKDYDKQMKNILDKEQYKEYRKEMRQREQERQRMQNAMGPQGGFPGGPGGFGGPGGPGGFGGPGGGFGGPGGF